MFFFIYFLFALCFFLFFPEAREAFIKQFSLLEASAGRLSAQLHGITSALNCSISTTEEERTDGGSRAACQAFAETTLVMRASQEQLKQATLDLDTMVGRSNVPLQSYVDVTYIYRCFIALKASM